MLADCPASPQASVDSGTFLSRRPIVGRIAFSGPSRRPHTSTIAFVFFAATQDFAFAGVVRLTNDAFLFHPLHQGGGTIIADLEPALNVARRGAAAGGHDRHRLLVAVA